MKRIALTLLIALITQSTMAQYDPEAKSILDAMSSKYKKMNAFSATFDQQIENQSAGVDEKMTGEITVKGGKYKLVVLETEIFNNGKEIWVFSPELEEVTVSPYDPEEEEITPGNVYDLYKNGFKYALISVMSNGDRILELDPESREKSYHKIRMIIATDDELKKFTVFEKSGNKYVYTVKNLKAVSGLTDADFSFDTNKYPDVEIIDFR